MRNSSLILTALISSFLLSPALTQAREYSVLKPIPQNADRRQDNRSDKRTEDRSDNRQEHRQDVRQNVRQVNRIIARSRTFRNIIIVRPHGQLLTGYGFHHNDNDAYKWLAFTAITLKVLDNINEQAQRQHEAAQIKATTANVAEKIIWTTADASGYVVTTKQGNNAQGLTCREFQQSIKVGTKVENAYGTACLQADGAWKII